MQSTHDAYNVTKNLGETLVFDDVGFARCRLRRYGKHDFDIRSAADGWDRRNGGRRRNGRRRRGRSGWDRGCGRRQYVRRSDTGFV